MTQSTGNRIQQIIENAIGSSIGMDQLLLESGLVDSITAVDIVLAVESEFGIMVPATDIGSLLTSTRTLAEYVSRQLA